jgi:release factor glutamine methyltransferase
MSLEEAAAALAAAGIDNPRAEARLLLAHALGVSRDATLSTPPLTPDQAARFAGLVARRTAREPLAYICGRKEFWSMDFAVGPGVLVPRPDTETLIEEAIRLYPDRTLPLAIADLGAGSGAILIAALKEFPNAKGIGFESSPDAFFWACRNVHALMPARAEVRLAGWKDASGPFDLVFSNPPYIPTAQIAALEPEVRDHEPRAALDGGPDGLDAYRALGRQLPGLLKPGGHAILEIGAGQAAAVEPLFAHLEILRLAPDLAGVPRALVLRDRGWQH